MLAIVLALSSSLAFGISDFYGALATRRIGAVSATFAAYSVATIAVGVGLLLIPGAWSFDTVLAGAIAGVLVAFGFLLFFSAMSVGPVAVLAPLIAVMYAIVPVAWDVARGASLSALAWGGVIVAVLSVLALSIPPRGGAENEEERAAERAAGRGTGVRLGVIIMGALAALGMGLASVALDYAPKDSGISSAFVESAVAVVVLGLVFVFSKRPAKGEVDSRALGIAAGSGVLMAVANATFVLALQNGSLALVGVLVALYPLSTILLARWVLREQLSRVQWLGIAGALAAAVLIGLG